MGDVGELSGYRNVEIERRERSGGEQYEWKGIWFRFRGWERQKKGDAEKMIDWIEMNNEYIARRKREERARSSAKTSAFRWWRIQWWDRLLPSRRRRGPSGIISLFSRFTYGLFFVQERRGWFSRSRPLSLRRQKTVRIPTCVANYEKRELEKR